MTKRISYVYLITPPKLVKDQGKDLLGVWASPSSMADGMQVTLDLMFP